MLKSVDILLGLSVVMLMVSLVVTVLTGAITNLLQTRGKNLRDGIASLLVQIHPALPAEVGQKISEAILTHPLIRAAGTKFGTVIHREELTALLLELAAGEVPNPLDEENRKHLCALLQKNGISDPAATMANVRAMALTLQQNHPELSNYERMAAAFLQEARSTFLGKINGWFDATVDRVADRFTNSTRIITFCGAFVVAFALQLDTVKLVGRLNTDPTLRQALVEQAIKTDKQPLAALSSQTPEELKANLQNYADLDVIDAPASLSDWGSRWMPDKPNPDDRKHFLDKAIMKLIGILLSTMLLSLGAPFWYNALKNLIRLRSLIAQKDDDQRADRQNVSPAGSSGTAAAPPNRPLVITGERGTLTNVG